MDKKPKAATARPGDATDKQMEAVAGGRYQDEHGHYREGEWQGHHYHEGYRGHWDANKVFIRL